MLRLLLLTLLLAGCSGKFINQERYLSVVVGAPVNEVMASLGKPYDVRKTPQGQEYRYIERLPISKGYTVHRHYIFMISDGHVVDKRYEEIVENPIQATSLD